MDTWTNDSFPSCFVLKHLIPQMWKQEVKLWPGKQHVPKKEIHTE